MFTHTTRSIWEEIIERSIQNIKEFIPKRVEQQPMPGSGAESVEEEPYGAPKPEEIMIIEVT
jgi:hypothetical protein